ncbi:phosphate ABC transporter substrate-binding/OmpA family protein [Litoreibacter roseus]|uniref:OmpA family protein n=1 Tax=Litoreibacter roseus TaxID=2601869 RepID=A0A6N6J9I7_9RHOB|nr:phosphate ABC transporter substrate-binding/OmpA family protein [Litoreibacter roseus]GFE62933.1 OmpA family protein [Litoreibacter roseus]
MKSMTLNKLLSGTALGFAMLSAPAFAEPVTLTTEDGSITISGEIKNFDGTNYTIETVIGTVIMSAQTVSCQGAACPVLAPQESQFKFAGSRALADSLIPTLISDYSKSIGAQSESSVSSNGRAVFSFDTEQAGKAEIEVASTNSRDGFEALVGGDATFALATRPARNREVRAAADAGKGELRTPQQEHIVAVDGLLLVTHPDNPVRAVSEVNAALAFSGRIANWSELGGNNAPINLYVREADSGSREVFDNLVMRPNGLAVAANVTVLDSDQAISDAVQQDPNGFGFTSFANVGEAAALDIQGVCGLRTPASAFTIKTEEYPLTRLMYMYQAGDRLDYHAKGFLDYLETDEAQEAVARAGFVDQSISSETINSQGIRVASAVVNNETPEDFAVMRDMLELLLSSDRMSTTYRFETGSARLDARAQADVARLAELLESDRFRNKEILFVGFTDSVGKSDLNQLLSLQRAELVRRNVLAENPSLRNSIKTRAVGFGEVSPLGCNETDTGRRINRRVEVWVQDIVAADQS